MSSEPVEFVPRDANVGARSSFQVFLRAVEYRVSVFWYNLEDVGVTTTSGITGCMELDTEQRLNLFVREDSQHNTVS